MRITWWVLNVQVAFLLRLLHANTVTSQPLTVLERPKCTMLRTFSDRFAAVTLIACGLILNQAAVAQGTFYSVDLESGTWPAGTDIGPDVERLDADGQGTGEFVPAWRIANAAEANAAGSFPVSDIPTGNRFAMANDDAAPCNCDMAEVALTLELPSFVGRNNVALQCRIFNEQTLGGGEAHVEVSVAGNSWIQLATAPVLIGEWQPLQVNLSAFDGLDDIRIRFRWSDNGNWASGFAVDDIILTERFNKDVAVTEVLIGDPTASAFQLGDQRLAYSSIPLEQVSALTLSSVIQNKGTQVLSGVTISTSIVQNGNTVSTVDSILDQDLIPGEYRTVVLSTGWVPAEAGVLSISTTATIVGTDEEVSNNTAGTSLLITGSGWDLGYGAMARDNGVERGTIGGNEPFVLGNRMELPVGGSIVRGMSAYLTANSTVGARVRAMLMDANLAYVDTSLRHALTQEDLDRAGLGGSIYLPFSGLQPLAAGDYYVCIQHLDGGLDSAGVVHIGLAGTSPLGAAINMRGATFVVDYLRSTPMVRMHLEDYAVGIDDAHVAAGTNMHAFPVPMSSVGTLRFPLPTAGHTTLRIRDLQGRVETELALGVLGAGEHSITFDAGELAQGVHILELLHDGQRSVLPIVVAR